MKDNFPIEIRDILRREDCAYSYGQELLIVILQGKKNLIEGEKHLLEDSLSILFTRQGCACMKVNETECRLEACSVIDILNTDILQNMRLSPDYEGIHLIISLNFLDEIMRHTANRSSRIILNRMENLYLELTAEEAAILQQALKGIMLQLERKDQIYGRELLKTYVKIFLLEFLNMATVRRKESAQEKLNKDTLIARFMHLLNENCCERPEVRWYAGELCIDATCLSRLLKSVNGKTANQWITDARLRKARLYLSDADTLIKDIADKLNFSDQAAFGKFFRKQTGLSPQHYRREQQLKKGKEEQEDYLRKV